MGTGKCGVQLGEVQGTGARDQGENPELCRMPEGPAG